MEAFELNTSKKEKLLLIDDSPADLALCTHKIKKSPLGKKFDVVPAKSCEEALNLFKLMNFACCLVDYHLPANSGMDFLKYVRRMACNKDIPIIIMSGLGDERMAVDVMRNGAQDYLVKNDLSPETINESVESALYASELQNKMRLSAHYDNLTGLLNRALFMDRLKIILDQCDRYQQSCSLLYIDVDNFKQLNDQYGHEAGDVLLKEVASRIKENCRTTDSPARLGGDEFAILLTHITEEDTQSTAAKILEKVSQPIHLDSHSFQVSLSIGIAHYPDTANNLQELMNQADEAMYKAKRSGKANFHQFTPQQRQLWDRRKHLENILPKAIENNELKLAFQPIINANDQELHGLEVLTRWFPEEESVPASELMEIIERLNLFDAFHDWLIQTSLEQLSKWQNTCPDLQLSLNIPANQCHSKLVMNALHKLLSNYSIKPEQIELEITETTLMKHPTTSSELLLAMQKEGVRVAIDDFGTGYSSMAYLTTLPLDTLKIDQHFFMDAENDIRNRKVVEAVTALGHSLGLKVVAEGVETAAQYQFAKDIGCDYIQGFYFAKPTLGTDNWQDFITQLPDTFSRLNITENVVKGDFNRT